MEEQYSEGTGRPMVGQQMIGGWRRFFTRSYWAWQWRLIRCGRRPLNVVAVGTLEVPEDPAEVAKLGSRVVTREEWAAECRARGEII